MEKKKTFSFYLMAAGAILSLIGLLFYRTAAVTERLVFICTGISIALTVLMIIMIFTKIKLEMVNLLPTICAVLLGWTLITSFRTQLDPLGWWVSGLYTFEQVRGFLVFAGCILVAIIFNMIASFKDIQK